MDSEALSTKDHILRSAYSLFYREGFSRVSVDAIAERAKLTKRTVYYHFKSKDDIVAAALEDGHRQLMPQFQEWAGPETTRPEELVANLFSALRTWAERDSWLGSGFSRIVAELADMPGHPARRVASAHKEAVEAWLSRQLEQAGSNDPAELARQVMTLIEGGMSLALIHGNAQYIESAGKAAALLVRTADR